MMNRSFFVLAPALTACAISAFPLIAAAGSALPSVNAPPGWTARDGRGGSQYFLPPGATTMDVYEAIFPTQTVKGSLEDSATALWHSVIGTEHLVDSKAERISVSDGAPAYQVLVATVNDKNQGVYRVFIFKQYGERVAAGELRFDDIERIKTIGQPALQSLENMAPRYEP